MTTRKNALKEDEPSLPIEKNMMVLTIGYNDLVLTVKEGAALLIILETAYSFSEKYGDDSLIKPLDVPVKTTLISGENYRKFRRNYLLGVNNDTD